jgi:hypothetical protein
MGFKVNMDAIAQDLEPLDLSVEIRYQLFWFEFGE